MSFTKDFYYNLLPKILEKLNPKEREKYWKEVRVKVTCRIIDFEKGFNDDEN